MALTNIMIEDTNLYATSGTRVNKDGSDTTLGDGGEGDVRGTEWFADLNQVGTNYEFKAFKETKIDLQGLEYHPIATLGFDIIESEAPSFFGVSGNAYLREYSILSTQKLKSTQLLARIELFTAPLPFEKYRAGALNDSADENGLMTREQCLGGRSQLYALDSSLPVTFGFGRKLSSFDLNMGSEVSTDALYYYRVIYAYGSISGVAISSFYADIPARTTIVTLNVRDDADDTQIATGMIRAYQAPTQTGAP